MKKSLLLASFIAVGLNTPLQAMDWMYGVKKYITRPIRNAFTYAPKTTAFVGTTALLIALIGLKKYKKKRLKNRVAAQSLNELIELNNEGNFNPRDVVLLWDLHGVSSKPNYPGILRGVWNDGAIWSGIRASFNPQFWREIGQYRAPTNQNRCYEPFFDRLSNIEQITQHKDLIMSLIHEQRPVPGVIELINEVRQRSGLQANMLFTNNGAQSHQALMQKPGYEYLQNFDHTFLAQGINQDAVRKLGANVTALQATKPHAAAFEAVSNTVNQRYKNPTIILIDDKVKNVIGARANGIHAILFQSREQLARDLQTLGLYQAQPEPKASSSANKKTR